MSLRAAILGILDARSSLPAEMADRMGTRDRATFYRVASGETADPRVGTLLAICAALAIGPGDLLQLAGLYRQDEPRASIIDLELRRAFAEIQQLDEDARRDCLVLMRAVIGSRAQRARRKTPQQSDDPDNGVVRS
jgi:DNA-binding Xre family transcriptional regulator